jgi:hypothetical protein
MKIRSLFGALLLTSSTLALAAPDPYIVLDHSSETLMDGAVAGALWKDYASDKVRKLYPSGKWGFVSQVLGGFTADKTCVVTARAMILPRSRKDLIFRPAKTATTFGTQAGASNEQCKALAKTKLGEAIAAIEMALVEH